MLRFSSLAAKRLQECAGYTNGGHKFKVHNATARTLVKLRDAGERGLTPAELNVPALSSAIHRLRAAGMVIETRHTNDPAAGGRFDRRYILRSTVLITAFTVAMEYRYGA